MAHAPRTHRIPLIGGGHALIDPCDHHLVSQYQWRHGGNENKYAVSLDNSSGTIRTHYLHRLIMAAGPGDIIDHKDGDRLNCRRNNLRHVTPSENNVNKSFTNSSTGYRGVVWHPRIRKYKAQIERDGVYRGPFRKTAEEAAHDADALLRGLYSDVATFNFPRPGERGIKRPGSEAA